MQGTNWLPSMIYIDPIWDIFHSNIMPRVIDSDSDSDSDSGVIMSSPRRSRGLWRSYFDDSSQLVAAVAAPSESESSGDIMGSFMPPVAYSPEPVQFVGAVPPPIELPVPAEYVDQPQQSYVLNNRSKGVCWVFTHFCHDDCQNFPKSAGFLVTQRQQYSIIGGGYQLERCPSTQRLHVQGWFSLDKEIQFMTLKSHFCPKIRFGKMNGSVQDSIVYCSKEETRESPYVAFGSQTVVNPHCRSKPGARNDLDVVQQALRSGAGLKRIAEDYFSTYCKYSNGITKAARLMLPERANAPRRFVVYYGEPGAGKSWKARDLIGEDTYYQPEQNNSGILSFESYDGQSWILLEDFDPKSLSVCVLKRITDRYHCILPGRGSSPPGLHNGVIITTNYPPTSWYPDAPLDYSALQRRMTDHFTCKKAYWYDELTRSQVPNPLPKFD